MGSLNQTMSPSPANHPTVASNRVISSPIAVWNSRMTPITSSGSVETLNAVQPRRSANSTAISRRWLSRMSSPCDRSMSASVGERNRRRRVNRSSSSTCSATRVSSPAFRAASSADCASMVSWYRLIRTSDRTRPNNSCLLKGLVMKSSASASMALTRTSVSLEVIITTGRNRVAGSARILRHTSYPFISGIWMSSMTRSGSLAPNSLSASCPEAADLTA